MRLDLDNDSKPVKDWQRDDGATDGAGGDEHNVAAVPIDSTEVNRRGGRERAKTTK